MKVVLIIITILLLNVSSPIHQDTPLKIDKNGNIIGLPKEFGNSKFDSEKGYLKINNKEIIFPQCVRQYFYIHNKPKLNLSASWYHSKDIMPYYLNFNISQSDKDYEYTILVDLETLELIYINITLKQENSSHEHRIELDDNCLTDYQNRIKNTQ